MDSYVGINWQYTNDPNDIDQAIKNKDENWEGLESANQIISITYDTNHGCYVVFWKYECFKQESKEEQK